MISYHQMIPEDLSRLLDPTWRDIGPVGLVCGVWSVPEKQWFIGYFYENWVEYYLRGCLFPNYAFKYK